MALEAKKEKQPKFGAKGKSHVSAAQDKNVWLSLIYMLQKKYKLPLVAFTFSRKRCDENAKSLTSLDLTDGQEKHKINSFFEKSISILKGTDKQLPQVTHMKDLLKRGIGVHHSGILPIIKEIVEMLFGQGLVGLLFATETFAMGVNMPARTVAFDAISKYDGDKSSSRELYPGEYVQMAGRAGRRGKDTTGTVIILCKGDVHEEGELHKMILGKPTTLESQFRLTYSMLLNIMRVQTLRVQDVMKRSFAELDSMKNKIDRQEQLLKLEEKIGSLDNVLCSVCTQDIDKYYQSCEQYIKLQREMQKLLLENRNYKKSLTSGCVLIIWTNKYKHSLAILLQQNAISKKYTVLVLCNHGDHSEEAAISLTDFDENHITPYCELNELFVPENEVKYNILDISGLQIIAICKNTITVNGLRLINEYKTSQFPRFKDRAPSPEMSKAVEILRQLSIAQFDDINVLDPISNLKVENMDYVEKRDKLKPLQKILPVFECIKCPLFDEHFGITRKKAVAKNELKQLRYLLSEESLLYLPEYQCKLDVLRHFGFISKDGTVTLKGRVACEIHTQEVILTEILFRNVLRDFKPAEIAALLSCMVLQQENCSEPNYTENLTKGKKMILQIAEEIAEVEISCGLSTSVEDYQKQFKFGLVEVVHEWANGKEFIEIVQMTDVMEGTIVKCVQRLDELCRDIAKAARTVGDPSLGVLMQEVSTLIRRDIIFAASLYTI